MKLNNKWKSYPLNVDLLVPALPTKTSTDRLVLTIDRLQVADWNNYTKHALSNVNATWKSIVNLVRILVQNPFLASIDIGMHHVCAWSTFVWHAGCIYSLLPQIVHFVSVNFEEVVLNFECVQDLNDSHGNLWDEISQAPLK